MDIITEILEIEAACFDRPWGYETLSFEIHSPLCVLAYEQREGHIVSYALGHVIADEGELLRIGTAPALRRQGLAETVLTDFLEKARKAGAARCFLEVRSRNAAAIPLYEKRGFKRVGLRKKYYGSDDAIVMAADLTEDLS